MSGAGSASHILFSLDPMAISTVVLLITYGAIIWDKLNRSIVALLGASIMVLIGVLDQSPDLVFHDPENAPRSAMDLSDFNSKRQRWQYSQMRRDGVEHHIRLYQG